MSGPVTIELSEYERDNLKWALECIRLGYVRPMAWQIPLNSGDWVGQISFRLGPQEGRPNRTLAEVQEALSKQNQV